MNARTRIAWALLAVAAALPVSAQTSGTTYYVSTTGADTIDCGPSSAPCRTIQWAADGVGLGVDDVVRVRAGTYNECVYVRYVDSNTQQPLLNGFSIVADDFLLNQRNTTTIIDGTNCEPPVGLSLPLATVTLGEETILRGFTIKGGTDSGVAAFGRNDILDNVIEENDTPSLGGGVYLESNGPLTDFDVVSSIKGNTIRNNTAGLDGAGIYVFSFGDVVVSEVEIQANTLQGNVATGTATLGGRGGGISIQTGTATGDDVSKVLVKANVIDGNEARDSGDLLDPGLGGGVYAAAGYQAPGTEEIRLGDSSTPFPSNIIRSNTAGSYGGGVFATLDGIIGAGWKIEIDNNTISNNETALLGGGVAAELYASFLTAGTGLEISAEGNELTGNKTTYIPDPGFFVGGGGIYALAWSEKTPASSTIKVSVEKNKLSSNTTAGYGGGAALFVSADSDPLSNGSTSATSAAVRFRNNLVAQNTATNVDGGAAGGGVYAYAQSRGAGAVAATELDFLTVSSNATDLGAGGIELEWVIDTDTNNIPGATEFDVSNSIINANESFGVGSLATPSGTASVSIRYNDAFGNQAGNYESSLTPGAGNISVDPALSATFAPSACSPTIDAADPLEPVGAESEPNGKRANMGHLGTTSAAIQTFPDTDGSEKIDGVDVLNVAFAFASTSAQPGRFNPNADRDLNNIVDGADLSYVTAFFGQSCP